MTHTHHSHEVDFKKAFAVEDIGGSMITITGELPYVELQSERTAALVALGKNVEIAGFRKGHIPTPVLEKHLGEMNILAEMAERAISHAYPHIVEEHKLEVIGHPKIEITKIAPGNPLGFTITVAVIPKFEIQHYEEIAKEVNKNRPSDEVTEEEILAQIKDIQRQKNAYEKLQQKATAKSQTSDLSTSESETTEADTTAETSLPELTDEYVKTLGQPGQFETVADFKSKLKEHLQIEKKQQNATKHRANITDSIIAKTEITLPQVLIDSEINQMFAQMEDELGRSNLKLEDYLSHIKKTADEIKLEWTPAATMRAKLQLILNEIARIEKITPDIDKVNEQTKEIMTRFKDADEYRVRLYVTSVLINEAVMQSLENK